MGPKILIIKKIDRGVLHNSTIDLFQERPKKFFLSSSKRREDSKNREDNKNERITKKNSFEQSLLNSRIKMKLHLLHTSSSPKLSQGYCDLCRIKFILTFLEF